MLCVCVKYACIWYWLFVCFFGIRVCLVRVCALLCVCDVVLVWLAVLLMFCCYVLLVWLLLHGSVVCLLLLVCVVCFVVVFGLMVCVFVCVCCCCFAWFGLVL